jgi:hypothetical protein
LFAYCDAATLTRSDPTGLVPPLPYRSPPPPPPPLKFIPAPPPVGPAKLPGLIPGPIGTCYRVGYTYFCIGNEIGEYAFVCGWGTKVMYEPDPKPEVPLQKPQPGPEDSWKDWCDTPAAAQAWASVGARVSKFCHSARPCDNMAGEESCTEKTCGATAITRDWTKSVLPGCTPRLLPRRVALAALSMRKVRKKSANNDAMRT